jgi:rSAM/selenodomain-associated transferase 1
LGAEGAADLQRRLTEHTLKTVESLTDLAGDTDISIYFSGGTVAQMQAWLGTHWQYQEQIGEGLGDRLINAFQASEKEGYQRTIIIGIDCPGITSEILQQAFDTLQNHDAVFGQAYDGGYYLVGLQTTVPELFTEMVWSTATVLAETLKRAANLGLSSKLLSMLHDIDNPEDLKFFPGDQD